MSCVPMQQHKAWSQRIQGMIVDGSPVWQVFRDVPLEVGWDVESGVGQGAKQGSAGLI